MRNQTQQGPRQPNHIYTACYTKKEKNQLMMLLVNEMRSTYPSFCLSFRGKPWYELGLCCFEGFQI